MGCEFSINISKSIPKSEQACLKLVKPGFSMFKSGKIRITQVTCASHLLCQMLCPVSRGCVSWQIVKMERVNSWQALKCCSMDVWRNCSRFKALGFACQCIGALERDKFCKRNACLKDLAKFSKMLEQVWSAIFVPSKFLVDAITHSVPWDITTELFANSSPYRVWR